ncbi:hypothetical protein [Streptosporangium jomthongense]|uniref:Uncharacterized protein n=1 Tax=Streptosporangium jomthongense TaxID=1193683 RepID=A0ABV8F0V2_9ACTN
MNDDIFGEVLKGQCNPARKRLDPTRDELAIPLEYLAVGISGMTDSELREAHRVTCFVRSQLLDVNYLANFLQTISFEIENALKTRKIKYEGMAKRLPGSWEEAVSTLPLEDIEIETLTPLDESLLLDRSDCL